MIEIPSARTMAGRGQRIAVCVGFGVVAAVGSLVACTVFDNLTPQQTFLDSTDEAARLCAWLFKCDAQGYGLAQAVATSAGVPLSDKSFSMCATWLTGPLPPNRIGLDLQRQMIDCMSSRGADPKATCESFASCVWIRPIDAGDARCAPGADICLDTKHVLDCHKHELIDCDTPRFSPFSGECRLGQDGVANCASSTCHPNMDPPTCIDGVSTECLDGGSLSVGTVCASEGLACTPGSNGPDVLCNFADCPSKQVGFASCSSDSADVEVCGSETTASRFNCTAISRTCAGDATQGLAYCQNTASPGCSPLDPAVCQDNAKLALCAAGKSIKVDCTSLGPFTCKDGACR